MLKIILCCCLAGLSVCHPVMATAPQLGRQYSVVENTVQNAPDVVAFFSFYCPPCAAFAGSNRVGEAVNNVLPAGSRVIKYHSAELGEMGEALTEAWSVAKVLGVEG